MRALTLALLVLAVANCALVKTYQNCLVLSFEYGVRLHWTITGQTAEIGMEGQFPNGFLAMGLATNFPSTATKPLNSDMWATSAPSSAPCAGGCVLDYYNTGEHEPKLDGTNNLQNKVYSTNGTHIFAEFTRALNTGDGNDKAIVPGTSQIIFWAGHKTKKISGGEIDGHRSGAVHYEGRSTVNFGTASTCDQSSTGTSFTGNGFRLSWVPNPTAGYIDFTMECDCTGWLSLGISTKASMTALDCYTGWVTGGQTTLEDSYSADSVNAPKTDVSLGGQNSVSNVVGQESGGKTTISFRRNLNTGDTAGHDTPITDTTLFIVYAYTQTSDTRTTKHDTYGIGRANFLNANATTDSGGTPGAIPTTTDIPPLNGPSYSDDDFKISWEISQDQQSITFLMEGRTTGWISMGVEDHQRMASADYYTGWVENGNVIVMDTWSPDYNTPKEDDQVGGSSNIDVLAGSEEAGWTKIMFRRSIITGDQYDMDIKDESMYLHWAIQNNDGTYLGAGVPASYAKHNKYGVSPPINLFTGGVAFGFAQIFSPGWALILFVGILFAVYVTIRMGHKIYKNIVDKRKRKALKLKPDVASTDIGQVESSPEDAYNIVGNYRFAPPLPPRSDLSPRPQTGTYYRGSMVVTPRQLQKTFDEEAAKTKSSGNLEVEVNSEAIAPKPSNSRVKNLLHGITEWRVPKTQFTVFFLVIVILYVLLNLACYYIGVLPYLAIGSLLAANSVLVTIPATRNSFFVWITGIPFDRTILYHRWLGRFVVILCTLHMILSWVQWVQGGLKFSEQQAIKTNVFGLIGWIASVFIFFSSLEIMRRRFYEIFHFLHYVFIIFFLFGALHTPKFVPFAIFAAVIYGLDKFLRAVWGAIPTRTTMLVYKPGDIIQVRFKKHLFARLFKMHRVGQYMFVNFPGISPLEWHPFSISSGPDETTVEVHIKALGDHTTKLVEAAKGKSKMWVRTDGPYGNHRINYRRFPVLILGAGGIGVTPIIGILKDCFRVGDIDPKARTRRNVVEKVYMIWVVQNMEQYGWFAEELAECLEASKKPNMPQLELLIYVTRSEENLSGHFIKGRPDFPSFFDRIVGDHSKKASTVFTCGPRLLVNNIWDCVNKRKLSGHTFHFHHETFEF